MCIEFKTVGLLHVCHDLTYDTGRLEQLIKPLASHFRCCAIRRRTPDIIRHAGCDL